MEELERGERLVEGRRLLSPLPLVGAIAAFLMIGGAGPSPLTVIAGVGLFLATLLTSAWFARHVSVTDRRLVEYRIVLARLARRWTRFARAEVRTRRVIPLEDVASARRSGVNLVLRTRTGGTHEVDCHDEETAVHLFNAVDGYLRRMPHLRPARRLPGMTVSVSVAASASDETTRCPYCHDAVPEDEAATCDRCRAVHHGECMSIHGGCAAFGCVGGDRRRVRG